MAVALGGSISVVCMACSDIKRGEVSGAKEYAEEALKHSLIILVCAATFGPAFTSIAGKGLSKGVEFLADVGLNGVFGASYYSLSEFYNSKMPTLRRAAESFVFAAAFGAGGKLVAPFIRPRLE